VNKMFKVCCCLNVIIREYDEDFALKELDWRQLDAEALREFAGDDGDRWLSRKFWFKKLDLVPAHELVPPEDDVEVDIPAPAPHDARASCN